MELRARRLKGEETKLTCWALVRTRGGGGGRAEGGEMEQTAQKENGEGRKRKEGGGLRKVRKVIDGGG